MLNRTQDPAVFFKQCGNDRNNQKQGDYPAQQDGEFQKWLIGAQIKQ